MGGSLITEVKETINEKIKEEADGKIGLEYEIDVETETFEMFQMPSLSRGKYLHDFKVHIQGVPSIGTLFRFKFLTFLIVLSKKSNLQF